MSLPCCFWLSALLGCILQGEGGISSGDNFVGKISFFSLMSKVSLRKFFSQFGAFAALCASSVALVAKYCCAVVGNQSVCHVHSSCLLGREKLVVVEKPFNSGEANHCESHRQMRGFMARSLMSRGVFGGILPSALSHNDKQGVAWLFDGCGRINFC